MEDPPTDKRVSAMLAVLLGDQWRKLEGEIAFEKTSVDSWVLAVETMLHAADGVDPIRVAIRGLIEERESPDASGSAMPNRAQ